MLTAAGGFRDAAAGARGRCGVCFLDVGSGGVQRFVSHESRRVRTQVGQGTKDPHLSMPHAFMADHQRAKLFVLR